MILGGIDANKLAQICLILGETFEDFLTFMLKKL